MTATPGGRAGPGSIDLIDPGLPGLCLHQVAQAGPFTLGGRRQSVQGHQTRPGANVLFGGEAGGASVTLRADTLGRAANIVLYPGVARRDFTGSTGSTVETILAARTLPLVAWQVQGPGVIAGSLAIDLALPTRSIEVQRRPDGVDVTGKDQSLLVRFSPSPADITIVDSAGGVTLEATLGADVQTTVVVTFGSPAEAASALSASAHLGGHALRAAAGVADGMTTATGIPALDDGLAWALSRVEGLSRSRPQSGLSLALAAIAFGDDRGADGMLDRFGSAHASVPGLVAARYGSTFGDVRHAARWADHLLSTAPDVTANLTGVAARSLAEALQYGARPETLAALRALAAQQDSGPTAPIRPPADVLPMLGDSGSGRSLPMAGGSSGKPTADGQAPFAQWLEGLLNGEPPTPPVVPDVRAARARRSASLFRREPERAWADWRAILDEGIAAGPAGPATWDDPFELPGDGDGPIDRPAATAELLLAFAHGMLGLSADAAVGRLEVAPRIPSHLTELTVRGIPVGSGRVGLSYERRGSCIRYTLDPERIAVPPQIVFQPAVSGTVRSITIDDARAELNLRPAGDLVVAPVQLALDAPRVVTIELG